jgi:hypothetical protein
LPRATSSCGSQTTRFMRKITRAAARLHLTEDLDAFVAAERKLLP